MAHVSRMLGLFTFNRGGPSLAFGRLLLLRLLLRDHLSLLSTFFSFFFFFKLAMMNRLTVEGGGGESMKRLGPWSILWRRPFSLVCKELTQAFLLVQGHLFFFFFLEVVVYVCDDKTGDANT